LVWERTKAGWPHAHVLFRGQPVSKHWLSRAWRDLTRSYIVDIRKVSSLEHAATYLTKYLTKDPQVPNGFRRWRRSGKFFNSSAEPPFTGIPTAGGWHRQPRDARAQAYFWLREGLALTFMFNGHVIATRDPPKYLAQMGSLLPHQLRNYVIQTGAADPTPY